jgi:hypothetical protein
MSCPIPKDVWSKELSHVQFRSLDEQLFRSMAVLFDQKQRHGVARLVGMNAPVSIVTPDVERMPSSAERTKRYLDGCYEKLPFALPSAKAQKQISDRLDDFGERILRQTTDDIPSTKRKIEKGPGITGPL